MKDQYFKDPLVSFAGEVPCKYTGSTDLYPRRNRNLINNENSTEAAIKIQRIWRRGRATVRREQSEKIEKSESEQTRKQMDELTLEERNQIQETLKKDVPKRFWSWFPI